MTTGLDFEGPGDLSVGEIRLSTAGAVVQQWMATPDARRFTSEAVQPGYYVAEIAPAGKRPQSVIFEVKRGIANSIVVPDFAVLAASGSAINFLNIADREEALRAIYGCSADTVTGEASQSAPDAPEADAAPDLCLAEPVEYGSGASSMLLGSMPEILPPGPAKLITVGLAIERAGQRESWDRFDGPCSARLLGGRLSIEIGAPADWTPASGRRVRLSLAIQGVRVERLLLPLYRGGTTVDLTCSPLSPNDVVLEVPPVDPRIRAVWRALQAGTRDHAAAVRDDVLQVRGAEPIALDAADPWEAMLAGLLYLRFPEEFGPLSAAWAAELAERFDWAADAHVIRARQLASDPGATPEAVLRSASAAVDLLIKAQARGAPYFNQSNQFFIELIESLASTEIPPDAARRIVRARHRWQREQVLQRRAGVSFSWLGRDPLLLKQGVLAPKRNPSGRLTGRSTTVVFKGRLADGTIAFETLNRDAPKMLKPATSGMGSASPPLSFGSDPADMSMPSGCPALMRPPGPPDDPNKGRFGGVAAAGGFRLSAEVSEVAGKVATVLLRVDADAGLALDLGDSVWLCLHPTFNPEWVKLMFRGSTATLTVKAWGGFTVGAWIPSRQVELECDLAEMEGAPAILRDN